ncbi:sex comb on midleg-like protein 1 isoform X2 [Hyaena hyaena]|uniref:sex comb on midleg-like protein 1 isoform X2 n=1 Tax=Hyaena hyaena TaxID=95912 RepID=UPI001921B436|nr:sex comb on midleg-like protein 1 isoform X2 [Hyaena hyaena]
MSSGSSEVDVQGTVVSDTAYNEDQQKTVQNVLSHCQVIYDAVQNLDKKFDVIHGKISKIHRLRVKSLWQSRKPLGYAYRNYNYLLFRKNRYQKMRKKDTSSILSDPKSYSPTIPVERPNSDSQSNYLETSYQLDPESPDRDPELIFQEQESRLNRSPSLPAIFGSQSYRPYFTPDPPLDGSSFMPYCDSPGCRGTHSIFSPTRPSVRLPEDVLTQADPSPPQNPEMAYPSSLENQSFGYPVSPFCNPGNFATSSPIGNNRGIPRNFPNDPSTWSVDEVIQFLIREDPQTVTPIADVFRQHDIDGKALLLLKSDMMLKYMGLKLGTAVKLCHYIDGLRGDKNIDDLKNFVYP